jgi:DNA-binding LacI/PurR family transcriptional regulator
MAKKLAIGGFCMKKVTLETIAQELGTTKNTVSKAMRGATGVSDEMRSRVLKLACDYGYKNGKADLAKPPVQVTMVWLEKHFKDTYFWTNVCSGILECAAENGASLNTIIIDKVKEDISQIPALQKKYCEGVLVMGDLPAGALGMIKALELPMVVVDYYSCSIDCDYINTANKKGILKAMRHMAQMGHTKIGFVNNRDAVNIYSFTKRYEAYISEMGELGFPVDKSFVWPDSSYDDNSYLKEQLAGLESRSSFPTAFMCVNDITGRNLHAVLLEKNYKVPEDISIVGFDNIHFPFGPLLTTIDAPQNAIGRRALSQLLRRLSQPEAPFESIQINTTLIDRGTVRRLP